MDGLSSRTKPHEEAEAQAPRYDISIYDTPFSKLSNPKRVWIGPPSSSLEGIGSSLFSIADPSIENF
jgi:hypothetical protein